MKKRLLTLALATLVLLSLCAPAMAINAGDTAAITINGIGNAAVTAYRIVNVGFDYAAESLTGNAWANARVVSIAVQNGMTDPKQLTANSIAFYEAVAADIIANPSAYTSFNRLTLPIGMYLILASDGINVYEPMVGNVEPKYINGAWTLEASTVNAKASVPSLDKKINEATAAADGHDPDLYDTVAIGDDVTFDIRSEIPVYPANATDKTYEISDVMDQSLTYKGSFAAYSVKGNAETLLTQGDEYTLSPAMSAASQTFTAHFDYAKIAGSDQIHIRYVATVNSGARLYSDDNINTATLKYSTNPYVDGQYKEIPDEVRVYTYGIRVLKLDNGDATKPLENAEFNLFKGATATGTALSFTGVKGAYKLSQAGAPGATQTLVTDSAGQLLLEGLDEGAYALKETKAPAGYTLVVNNSTPVTIAKQVNPDEPKAVAGGITGFFAYVTTAISNTKVPGLPSTGGMGTTIFYIVGGALMVCAVAALLIFGRKKARKGE